MRGSLGFRRLSVKLGLLLFAAVGGALAIVYVAVLPQLESRLVDAKLEELERAAPGIRFSVSHTNQFLYPNLVSELASRVNARVVIFERLTETSLQPFADSSNLRSSDVQRDPVALKALTTNLPASGRVKRGEHELGEVAFPAGRRTIVLVSARLNDALANVRLVRKSLVIAGAIALAVSWLAGALAALTITRRISRLETAAEWIARGNFEVPVVDRGHDEIAQLADAFESMRLRLAHLEHARREFIANASHELRTPLFSLGGFLELLVDEDLDEATRQEFLGEMREQVDRLTRLATDLLDLSRLDADQLAVETRPLDVGEVARALVDEFRARAESDGRELRLNVDGAVVAVGDEQRVFQIGRALVENALRHTPNGTPVEVDVRRWEARALLVVRDQGPGIPAEDLEHLFERFYRGVGGKASGSGLGLAIAKELAWKMAGTLKVTSQAGETIFTLSLPLAGSYREAPAPTEAVFT